MTPATTPEKVVKARNEEICQDEGQDRKKLETDGCPPCYLASLGPLFLDILEKYMAIMSYWAPGFGPFATILYA